MNQYKAKGPVTDVLLPVVALDDAVGLVVFALSFGIAKSLNTGAIDVLSVILKPILEIVLSMERADRWTTPILILFFCNKRCRIGIEDMAVVIIGIIYVISRSVGKYFGANISAKITKSDPNIVKYLGITLLPQAGIALGMAEKAIELGLDGDIVRNITLFAVLIYEVVGPFLTKIALTKAGDIKEDGRISARKEL